MLVIDSGSAHGIEPDQIDDFEDGTVQNWIWGRSGFGGPVTVVRDGNNYLETESFGGDDAPGSRMALINRAQWTGDFVFTGISAIRLNALNDGPNFAFEDMTVRIGFSSEAASIGSGRVITTQGFSLSRDEGWKQFEFDLNQLTAVAGSDVAEVMSSVSEMRIFSAEEPVFIGDQFIARLGLDNITAITVPEPNVSPVLFFGIAVCLLRARQKRVS